LPIIFPTGHIGKLRPIRKKPPSIVSKAILDFLILEITRLLGEFKPESASSILQSLLLQKLLEKLAPFEKFRWIGKEEARPGGGIMENCCGTSGEN